MNEKIQPCYDGLRECKNTRLILRLEARCDELLSALKGLMSWEDAPLVPTEYLGGAECLYCEGKYGYQVETDEWVGRHNPDCPWEEAQETRETMAPARVKGVVPMRNDYRKYPRPSEID